MLVIFIAISESFIDSGFSNALIRKTNPTERDFSTVFYFNIVIGLFFYLLLFFTSPYIARFYQTPILEGITKVIALNLLFNSLSVVQRAKYTINVDFKTQAKASTIAALISGTTGITLAYAGFGVWSLVVQTVSNTGINMILLWIYAQWKPQEKFSYQSFKSMFSYGSKLLISGLINTIYNNIYTLVIGKKFTAVQLGYYTRANQFAQFPSANLTGILGRVIFPVLSGIQDDEPRLCKVYRQYLRLSVYLIFPLMIGLAAIAQPLIYITLTDKWSTAAPLLQILCFCFMWYPVQALNLNLLQVKGRSDIFLKLEIAKKIIGVGILLCTLPYGVVFMCLGSVLASIIALLINTRYTGRLIHVNFMQQIRDLLPSLLYAGSMGIIVFSTISFIANSWLQLFAGIAIGVIYYIVISYITGSKELQYLFSLIKEKYHGK